MNTNFIRDQIERYTGKITPAKALVALAVVYIVVRILGAILGLFDAVLPFVLIGLLAYFGYQFLQSSSPTAENIKQRVGDLTASRRAAAEQVSADVMERVTKRATAPVETVAQAPQPAKVETVNTLVDENAETLVEDVPAPKISVAEKVNPVTGLREPDLARLEEREKEQPSQDNVLSQLEERKRRLKGS